MTVAQSRLIGYALSSCILVYIKEKNISYQSRERNLFAHLNLLEQSCKKMRQTVIALSSTTTSMNFSGWKRNGNSKHKIRQTTRKIKKERWSLLCSCARLIGPSITKDILSVLHVDSLLCVFYDNYRKVAIPNGCESLVGCCCGCCFAKNELTTSFNAALIDKKKQSKYNWLVFETNTSVCCDTYENFSGCWSDIKTSLICLVLS